MSTDTVEISRAALSRLYGSTRQFVERDGQECYAADVSVLEEAELALGRDGPYRGGQR